MDQLMALILERKRSEGTGDKGPRSCHRAVPRRCGSTYDDAGFSFEHYSTVEICTLSFARASCTSVSGISKARFQRINTGLMNQRVDQAVVLTFICQSLPTVQISGRPELWIHLTGLISKEGLNTLILIKQKCRGETSE